MSQFRQDFSDWVFWLRGFFPQRLPIGAKDFDDFCTQLFRVYNLPDHSSYRAAISKIILHFGPQTWRKSPYFFVISIRAGQAREVAWQFSEDLRAEEKRQAIAAQEAAKAKEAPQPIAQGEATPPGVEVAQEAKAS